MRLKILFEKYYSWEGVDKHYKKVSGKIFINSKDALKKTLQTRSIILLNYKTRYNFNLRQQHINTKNLAQLCFQLSALLDAGIILTSSIAILIKDTRHHKLAFMLENIRKNIQAGKSLGESLSMEKYLFPKHIITIISAGEKSGKLTIILQQVAAHLDRLSVYKGKIKKALYYPFMICITAMLITIGLLIFVIPQFQTLYNDFGATLPRLTLMVPHPFKNALYLWSSHPCIILNSRVSLILFLHKKNLS